MNITTINKVNDKNSADITGFTDDQKKAYNTLLEFINKPYNSNDYKRALVGAAGTGKTYLIKALIKNCSLSYSVIGLSAPTHKACRILNESINLSKVKINTLQSDLGLKLNFNVENFDINNPPFDPKGRIKIKDYSLYIIDEASMINKGLCKFLEQICKTNSCKIIYIGDDAQLPPVNEKNSSAFTGIKINNLTQIVRQGEDNPVSYLLDLLRYDIEHKTFNCLNYISKNKIKFNNDNTKGYCVCNNKDFEQLICINFNDEALTRNIDFVKIIAYTNAKVSAWNKFVRNNIIKDFDKSVITKNDLIISYTTLINQFNDCIIKNSEEYIINDIVNYTHPKYNIKGFMIKFTTIHGGKTTSPLFVVNHKDNFSINKYVKLSRELIQSAKTSSKNLYAQRWKEYYKFKESCLLLTNILNNDGTIKFSRDLDYGFALTVHKSQGSTFDTVFVDVDDIVFNKYGNPYSDTENINRRLYVAISRCKNKVYLKYTTNNGK